MSKGTFHSRRILPESESTRGAIVRNQKRARLSAIGVSEKIISKLELCVCCEGRWKIKKSVLEKLNHIEACAKQHAYTLETVSILIKRELKLAAEILEQENTGLQRTHLEEVVQDAFPKRKSRLKKESTLREFDSQTRSDAMKRLRAIVGPPVNLDVQQRVSTQSSTLESLDNPNTLYTDLPPSSPVMPFLPSRLLQS